MAVDMTRDGHATGRAWASKTAAEGRKLGAALMRWRKASNYMAIVASCSEQR